MTKIYLSNDYYLGWIILTDPEAAQYAQVVLEVGEATAASWEHAQLAHDRAQLEIEDYVDAQAAVS